MRKMLIAGNWKMNGSRATISVLLEGLLKGVNNQQLEWAIFPPFVYLPMVKEALSASAIAFGGQNLSYASNGAYTGQVSAEMLMDFDCKYACLLRFKKISIKSVFIKTFALCFSILNNSFNYIKLNTLKFF